MKRLTGERAVGVAVLVFAAVVALAVWFLVHQERTRVVRPRVTVTMPAKKMPARKATPKRSKKTKRPRGNETSSGARNPRRAPAGLDERRAQSPTPNSQARTRPFKRRKRQASGSTQQPNPAPSRPSTPPQTEPEPSVSVPLPRVCTDALKINC